MQHPVLLGRKRWMHFEQRTYIILPRQFSQSTFSELSLTTPYTDGFFTFVHDNRPTTDTFRLELAGVPANSVLSEPPLVPVDLVRSSSVPALTGH